MMMTMTMGQSLRPSISALLPRSLPFPIDHHHPHHHHHHLLFFSPDRAIVPRLFTSSSTVMPVPVSWEKIQGKKRGRRRKDAASKEEWEEKRKKKWKEGKGKEKRREEEMKERHPERSDCASCVLCVTGEMKIERDALMQCAMWSVTIASCNCCCAVIIRPEWWWFQLSHQKLCEFLEEDRAE